jgi:hypothetical protein
MPRSPIGWTLTVAVPVLALVGAFLLTGGGGAPAPDARARAGAVCAGAQRELEQLPESPASVAEALEMERRGLKIQRREVQRLEVLAPRLGDSFGAGVSADRSLLAGLSAMLARPDFVKLSLTLPGHPDLVPSWLREWLGRERALLARARSQFSQAGITACARSLG